MLHFHDSPWHQVRRSVWFGRTGRQDTFTYFSKLLLLLVFCFHFVFVFFVSILFVVFQEMSFFHPRRSSLFFKSSPVPPSLGDHMPVCPPVSMRWTLPFLSARASLQKNPTVVSLRKTTADHKSHIPFQVNCPKVIFSWLTQKQMITWSYYSQGT